MSLDDSGSSKNNLKKGLFKDLILIKLQIPATPHRLQLKDSTTFDCVIVACLHMFPLVALQLFTNIFTMTFFPLIYSCNISLP